jgi:DNA-binding winged helix-turn-helix (wHTH) protein
LKVRGFLGGRHRNERLRFGDFEFDSLSGRLFRKERPVKIQPQTLRVLAVLLERASEIVSREHLRSGSGATPPLSNLTSG